MSLLTTPTPIPWCFITDILTDISRAIFTDLIGKTIIDLEDRWFDARWQKMGEENVRLPGSDPNDPTKV
jgi:hypothetical protein